MPFGVTSATAVASKANTPQRRALRQRRPRARTASAPRKNAKPKPNIKLPCRLAHNAITGSRRKDGAASASRAAKRAPAHSTKSGRASRWGRASR